ERCPGTNVHDPATTQFAHARQQRLRAENVHFQVQRHRHVQIGDVYVFQPAGGYEAHVVDQAVIGPVGGNLRQHLLDGVALSQVHRVEGAIVRPVGGARACDAGYGIAIGSQAFADAAADAAAGA